jgi:dihydrofolate synthase/folylpolyglutamate synthase
MASLLIPHFSRIIITTPGSFKKSFPREVYLAFVKQAARVNRPPELLFIPETGKAIETAVETGKGRPILGTGSFYLASEIREAVL